MYFHYSNTNGDKYDNVTGNSAYAHIWRISLRNSYTAGFIMVREKFHARYFLFFRLSQ